MIIYLDALIILNFIFDYLLLITVNLVLKRNTKKIRIIISALIGEISILFLIFNFNYVLLIITKILLAIIMNIISFQYQNLKYTLLNLSYFYMLSIILGGFLFFLKLKNINYFFSLLLVPLIFIIYVYQAKSLKIKYQNYYQIKIKFLNKKEIITNAYLDTGNILNDPISNKPIIILDKRLTKGVIQIRTPIYVPYNVLNHHDLLKCIKPDYIEIGDKKIKNVLIGIMENKIKMDGIGCILNRKVMDEL